MMGRWWQFIEATTGKPIGVAANVGNGIGIAFGTVFGPLVHWSIGKMGKSLRDHFSSVPPPLMIGPSSIRGYENDGRIMIVQDTIATGQTRPTQPSVQLEFSMCKTMFEYL